MKVISVLMSVFNENEEELRSSVDSILNQSFADFEFIITIDNPTNEMLNDILSEYARLDSRIVLIKNQENIGLAESLNRAASVARGKYFCRMDADDISVPDRLQKQHEVISKKDYDLVCSSFYYIDENGKVIGDNKECYSSSGIKRIIKYKNVIHHPTVIMKADAFYKVGGYNNFPCAQDYDLWLRMVKYNYRFYMMKDKLIYYRIRPESTSFKKRYLQQCTIEYIQLINRKKLYKFSPEDYWRYLANKKVDNSNIADDFKKYMDLYASAKKDLKEGNILSFVKKFLKVYIHSKYFRPNIIRVLYTSIIRMTDIWLVNKGFLKEES